MKYENLFKIHIPEPCHEDWNKMNPNQQGAFCKVCSKTVVDFSGKTSEEIHQFFSENLDKKVCGRFNKEQLSETARLKNEQPKLKIEIPKFLFPLSFSPVRSFTMAILLFASVALASCGNSETGVGDGAGSDSTRIEHLLGGATIKPQNDSTGGTKDINQNKSIKDSLQPPEWNNRTMGAVNWSLVKKDTLHKADTSDMKLGEVYTKPKTDSVQTNKHIKMGMVKKTPEKEYLKGDVEFKK